MSDSLSDKLLEYLIDICNNTNDIILEVYNSSDLGVQTKSDDSPLTIADKRASDYICDALDKWDPTIPIICEETKLQDYETRKNWNKFWLVDPLDGTKEFIKRNGEFTVNIALIDSGEPIVGIIAVPVTGELYYAQKGRGSFKIHESITTRLSCHPFNAWDPVNVICSRSHLSEATKNFLDFYQVKDMVSCGSSLKFMLLCENKAHIYPRLHPCMEWDIAAADIILTEAGGKINQLFDDKIRYNKPNLLVPLFLARGNLKTLLNYILYI